MAIVVFQTVFRVVDKTKQFVDVVCCHGDDELKDDKMCKVDEAEGQLQISRSTLVYSLQ